MIVVPGAITVARATTTSSPSSATPSGPGPTSCRASTAVFNLTGIPSLSIPAGFSDGLPVGIQIAGPPYAEGVVLAAAHAYQRLTDHHQADAATVADDSAQRHPGWDPSQRNVPDEAPVITRTLDSTWWT